MKHNKFLARYWWVVALAAALMFFILTLVIGSRQSVWFDETYSTILAKSSWGNLWHLTAVDAHPPLYYALLKLWGMVSWNDTWLRTLSAIFAAAAVFFALVLARKISDQKEKAVIFVTPFLVFAPFLLRYGFEIRMYSLAILIAVVSSLVLVIAREKSPTNFSRWWVFYAVLVAIGMWTLNLTVFVFLAQFVWLVSQEFSGKKSLNLRAKIAKLFRTNFMKSYYLSIALYLPWLWFAVDQLLHDVANHGALSGFAADQIVDVARETFVFQPSFLSTVQNFLLLAAIAATIFLGVKFWRTANEILRENSKLLLFMLFVPTVVFLVWGILSDSFFTSRYFAIFSWALYLLVGLFSAHLIVKKTGKKTLIWLSVLVIFVTQVFGVINLARIGNGSNNWQKNMAVNLRELCDADDTKIIVNGPQLFMEIQYYLPDCANLTFYANWSMPERGGYAPMQHSDQQVYDFSEVPVSKIIWINSDDSNVVPEDYEEISRQTIDWIQRIDYEKNEEVK